MTPMHFEHLAQAVHQLAQTLQARQAVVVTAESCTGGLLAAALTEMSGSSAWFDRGWVTYSNLAKQQQLGVLDTTLDQFGAVSQPTAIEMASGALHRVPHATLAISTTGIAGPTGATPGKPVGLVWFAWAIRGDDGIEVVSQHYVFEGDRDHIRRRAVLFAIEQAQRLLTDPTI